MTSVAITDHGWMAGVINFYKECAKNDVKPILGCEIYVTENEDNLENEFKIRDNEHIVLLAKDNIGYSKLLETVSTAALNNFYYKPRVWKEHLKKLAGHVIVASACLGSPIAKRLEFIKDEDDIVVGYIDPEDKARREIEYYLNIFNKDFYLELQVWDDGKHHQKVYNEYLLKVGKELGAQFVLTTDAHFLNKEDYVLHELLMAMQFKMTIENYRQKSVMQYGPYFYVANSEEMLSRAKFLHCESAFYNTQIIADQCNVELTLGKYQEPTFDITQADDYQDYLIWKEKNESI